MRESLVTVRQCTSVFNVEWCLCGIWINLYCSQDKTRPVGKAARIRKYTAGREHLFVVRSVPGKAVTAPGGWHSCEEVIIFRASLITFMPWGGRAGEPGNFIWIMGQSPAFLHFMWIVFSTCKNLNIIRSVREYTESPRFPSGWRGLLSCMMCH